MQTRKSTVASTFITLFHLFCRCRDAHTKCAGRLCFADLLFCLSDRSSLVEPRGGERRRQWPAERIMMTAVQRCWSSAVAVSSRAATGMGAGTRRRDVVTVVPTAPFRRRAATRPASLTVTAPFLTFRSLDHCGKLDRPALPASALCCAVLRCAVLWLPMDDTGGRSDAAR